MKNGISRREEFSPAEISKVLERYRRSGLGAVQFAQEHGIPPGRLHYWIHQKGRSKSRRPLLAAASKPVFRELEVATMLPVVDGWVAEVKLPDGLAVRFGPNVRAEWIGSVVQALRRPC
jgi:transposase-like protein